MAVTSVNEHHAGRRSAIGDNDIVTYKRVFRVITDSASTSPEDVRTDSSIPVRGAEHPDNSAAHCRNVEAYPTDDERKSWLVVCTYDTKTTSYTSSSTQDPTELPAKIRWMSREVTKVAVKDKDGNPVDNSAGEPFDPPIEIEDGETLLMVSRYEDNYDPAEADDYKYKVNVNAVTLAGFPCDARQAKLVAWDGERESINGELYWKVDYTIHFKNGGTWDYDVLDQGYYQLSGTTRTRITDDNGEPVERPAKLDGSGGKLAEGGTPVFLTFTLHGTADFERLNLGEI